MKQILLMGLLILLSACGVKEAVPDERPIPTQIIPTTATLTTPIAFRTIATETSQPTTTPLPTTLPTQNSIPTLIPTLINTPTITPTQARYTYIAIAIKSVPAGYAIPPDAVALYPWPADIPFSAILTTDEVVNKVALTDIHCFEPFIEASLALREVGIGFEELEACPVLPPQTGEIQLVHVVVATQYVDAGQIIRPGMVSIRQWPAQIRPAGSIGRFADVIGWETQEQLFPEQPIYIDMVVEP